MFATIKRCKHCHKTYEYSYDEAFSYNNEDYCPDCQKVIEEALSKVPVKYIGKYQEIDFDKALYEKMQKIKKSSIDSYIFTAISIGQTGLPFDKIEVYTINGLKYAYVKTDEEEHMYGLKEYDVEKDRFTSLVYNTFDNLPDSFCYDRQSAFADCPKNKVYTTYDGKLFYLDFDQAKLNEPLMPLRYDVFDNICDGMSKDPLAIDISDVNLRLHTLESNVLTNDRILTLYRQLGEDLETVSNKDKPIGKLFYLDTSTH